MITITVTILNSDHCKQTFLVLKGLLKENAIILIDSESVVSQYRLQKGNIAVSHIWECPQLKPFCRDCKNERMDAFIVFDIFQSCSWGDNFCWQWQVRRVFLSFLFSFVTSFFLYVLSSFFISFFFLFFFLFFSHFFLLFSSIFVEICYLRRL